MRTFKERLGSFQQDICAREVALVMGISWCFYDFSIKKQLFWSISYFTLQNKDFKYSQTL